MDSTNEAETLLKAKMSQAFKQRVKWLKLFTSTISRSTSSAAANDGHQEGGGKENYGEDRGQSRDNKNINNGFDDGDDRVEANNKGDLYYREKVTELLTQHLSTEAVARIRNGGQGVGGLGGQQNQVGVTLEVAY